MSSHPAFREALERALAEEVAHLLGNLAGNGVADWGDYQKRLGAIQGLQRVKDMCEEVAKELDQR